MQQRQLRLGDILDDYCPRERRLSNHTVVAMVGHEIRLTRCTTCETEHPYKGGKAPRLRKKKTAVQEAYAEVLDSVSKDAGAPAAVLMTPAEPGPTEVASNGDGLPSESETEANAAVPSVEEVRLHRPLIRAQLPRVERDASMRPAPEFTIRQASKRQGRFQNARPPRFAKSGGQANRTGNLRGTGGPPPGMRHGGRPQGHGSTTRPSGGRHQGPHPGKKRSR